MWPFRAVLHHFPWKADAVKWLERGDPARDTWMEWVFGSMHYVGYRPVAALSYTLNHLIAPYEPWVFRATDLALHATATVAVGWLFVTLTRCRPAWALLPALLFGLHPAAEEVVPYLARRSYALEATLSAGALALWLRSLDAPAALTGRSFLGSALLVAALLTNEVAYVVVPLLPLLAWSRRGRGVADALERSFIPWCGTGAAIALRFAVLGWPGGYDKPYFAFVYEGTKRLREAHGFHGHAIVGAAFEYTFLPVSMAGAPNPLRDPSSAAWSWTGGAAWLLADLTLFALSAGWLWLFLAEPLLRLRRDRAAAVPLLLVAWLVGLSALFALSGTWFWRQGYAMVMPLALLIGWVAHDRWTRSQGARRWVPLGAQLLTAVFLLWHSASVQGISRHAKIEDRFRANEGLRQAMPALDALPRGAHLWVAVPLPSKHARLTRRALANRLPGRHVRSLAQGAGSTRFAWIEQDTLHFGPGAQLVPGRVTQGAERSLPLARIRAAGQPAWLLHPGDAGWQVTRLQAPPAPEP